MRYAVTGATGWLGRAAVSVLRERGADVVAFASRARDDVLSLSELPGTEHDVLLHFAYVTRDHVVDGSLEAYVAANEQITDTVSEAVRRHRPAVFYASSGAAASPGTLAEDPYGALKRRDEQVLREVSGGRCAVARIYNVAGPHVTKPEAFLLTDLLLQARSGRLRVQADRPVVRSYVDVEDLAAWAVAAAGQDLLVSTAGDREVEAGELAELVREVTGVGAPVERPPLDPDKPAHRYVGDRAVWAAALQAAGLPERDLPTQVRRTAEALPSACSGRMSS